MKWFTKKRESPEVFRAPDSVQSLEGKLDYILKSNAAVQVNYDRDSLKDYDNLVPAIKQAFLDAGWNPGKWMLNEQEMDYIASKQKTLLSGQEWYDRFTKELDSWIASVYSGDAREVLNAAKRAAELENK